MANFMRKWSFAKARRQADVNARIERANNASLSLLKQVAVMLKPKDTEPVEWEKIYLHEDEFLDIESSIASDYESEDGEPWEQHDITEPIEMKKEMKTSRSFAQSREKFKSRARKTELFTLSQVEEDGSESSDADDFFKMRNDGTKQMKKDRLSKSYQVLPSLQMKKSVSLVIGKPGE